jgi:hypothetical protein
VVEKVTLMGVRPVFEGWPAALPGPAKEYR